MMRFWLSILPLAALAACGPSGSGGPVEVAVIGNSSSLFQKGVRLSVAAQHLRGATHEGLVALDEVGQVVPAVADRWIVTDDGASYIFKLRDSKWPDGEPITSRDVQRLLRDNIRRLDGTSLGLDFEKVTDIRAMAGRVVEIRLSSSMPDFLRLLAQPEMGFTYDGKGTGPMVLQRDEGSDVANLTAVSPETRGMVAREDWEALARQVEVRAMSGAGAVKAFSSGQVDLVLGGRVAHLPLAETGPLSRGTIRLDAALGLFGLMPRHERGVLESAAMREALSMSIDRGSIAGSLNIGGWQPSTMIVPITIGWSAGPREERWAELSLQERRALATQRVQAWTFKNVRQASIRIAMPEGPGSDVLFRQLAEAFQAIGVATRKVGLNEPADLELVDRLARYVAPRWYLNQFNCSINSGLCSEEADRLVSQAIIAQDPQVEQQLLAEAHRALMRDEVFIPLGAPIRWSLVRGTIAGFEANPWGLHPLFPLSQPPS